MEPDKRRVKKEMINKWKKSFPLRRGVGVRGPISCIFNQNYLYYIRGWKKNYLVRWGAWKAIWHLLKDPYHKEFFSRRVDIFSFSIFGQGGVSAKMRNFILFNLFLSQIMIRYIKVMSICIKVWSYIPQLCPYMSKYAYQSFMRCYENSKSKKNLR